MLYEIVSVFVLVVPIYLSAQESAGVAAGGQTKESYWIVASNEKILVRSRPGGRERALKAKYSVLRPGDEVFCSDSVSPAVSRSKGTTLKKSKACSLWFITSDDPEPQMLTDKIPPNRWVLLSSIKDVPEPRQIVKSSRELLDEMGKRTRRAGLPKGIGCSGTLPVIAPACGDTIDPDDFTVEWRNLPSSGVYASLFVETVGDFESRSIRFDRISLDAHRYANVGLTKFFEEVQKDSSPTNLVLQLSQSQEVEATRIITIQSRFEQREFRKELQMVKAQNPLVRSIALLSVYINSGFWSKAGNEARELLALAPDEDIVKTYALIGFCQSGYSREASELRSSLIRSGITDICPAVRQ